MKLRKQFTSVGLKYSLTTLILLVVILVLPVYSYSQETFKQYTVPETNQVNEMLVLDDGHILLASTAGLLEFDGAAWSTYTTDNGLPSNDIKHIVQFDHRIYVSTSGKGMATWDGTSFTPVNLQAPSDFGYFSYMFDYRGKLLLGTDNGKVFEMIKGSNNLTERDYLAQELGNITGMGYAPSSGILNILSTQGILLVATAQNNFEIRIKSGETPLTSDNVISGFMDGDISYDCTDKGITIADYEPGIPPIINTVTTVNSSLPSDVVNAISTKGNVWYIATDKGFAIRKSQTEWKTYNTSNANLAHDNVIKVVRSDDGTIWILTKGTNTVLHKVDENDVVGTDKLSIPISNFGIHYNPEERNLKLTSLGAEHTLKNLDIDVYDLQGRRVYDDDNKMLVSENQLNIDVSHLITGTYLLTIRDTDNHLVTKKFIVSNH